MAADAYEIGERLARQDPEEKRIRNELMAKGVGPREATRRAAVATGRIPAAPPRALTEAVAAAVTQAVAIRKARRKAAKRAARESAKSRAPGRQFTEAEIGTALRGMDNGQLASFAALAESGHSPFHRAEPGGAVTRAAADRGAPVTEAAVAEAAQESRSLASLSADGLREHLAGRLSILGEASGFRSPTWTGKRA